MITSFDEIEKTPIHVLLKGKTQCVLQSDNWFTVKWIPKKQAVIGNKIKLSNDPLNWIIIQAFPV